MLPYTATREHLKEEKGCKRSVNTRGELSGQEGDFASCLAHTRRGLADCVTLNPVQGNARP